MIRTCAAALLLAMLSACGGNGMHVPQAYVIASSAPAAPPKDPPPPAAAPAPDAGSSTGSGSSSGVGSSTGAGAGQVGASAGQVGAGAATPIVLVAGGPSAGPSTNAGTNASLHAVAPAKSGAPMLPVAGAGQAAAPKPPPPPAPPASATRAGSAAYYVPPRMVEGVSTNVDLWIDRAAPLATLQKELAARLQMTADRIRSRIVRDSAKAIGAAPVVSEVEGVTIPIGDTMIAHLKGGADFDIDPKDPVTQSLVGEERAKWAWRVTPKRAAAVLQLDLDIWIDPGAGKRLIDSYHEVVQVSARERTWIEIIEGINKILALFGVGGIGAVALAVWKLPKWLRERKASNAAAGRIIVGQG